MFSIESNREFEAAGLYISGMDYEYLCDNPGQRNMWSKQLRSQNRDYSIAMKIPQYLREAGLTDINCRMNDKVTFIEPQMDKYDQVLEEMADTENWFAHGRDEEKSGFAVEDTWDGDNVREKNGINNVRDFHSKTR